MCITLGNIQFCTDNCIIKRCGNLTYPTTIRFYGCTILICTCQFISTGSVQWCNSFIHRKFLSWVKYGSIDFTYCIFYICHTTGRRITEVGRERAQQILYLGKFFCSSFRLYHICYQTDGCISALPFFGKIFL